MAKTLCYRNGWTVCGTSLPAADESPFTKSTRVAAIVDATLQTKPAGMTHWSCRIMAQHQGVSKSTVNNIWRAHNLQPHRTETFKLSRDPKFLEKMTDNVVGLYLNPPQQAIILCVDEKSQIQALDQHPAGVAPQEGSMRHDDPRLPKRNGTTTLLRRPGYLAGQGRRRMSCETTRHQEFPASSCNRSRLDTEFPGDTPLHLIMDNYGTVHAKVKAWLKRNPRFVSHFCPHPVPVG